MIRILSGIAAILCIALQLSAAQAHSKKEATTPPNGAVLSESPQVIALNFDRPMRVTLVTLVDASGEGYDLERSDNMAPLTEFEAVPPALPKGLYTVDWRGLASDGHPMEGQFSFEIES